MKSVTLYECPKCGDVALRLKGWGVPRCVCDAREKAMVQVKYVPAAEVEALEGQIESNAAIMAENDNMLADFSEREVLWKELVSLLSNPRRFRDTEAAVRHSRIAELRRKLGIEEG